MLFETLQTKPRGGRGVAWGAANARRWHLQFPPCLDRADQAVDEPGSPSDLRDRSEAALRQYLKFVARRANRS